jgi:tetratricopeptide (TPR) repeat protein
VRESIEEGNAAFEARDYEGALEHYRAAVAADSTAAPAWFGVYMTYEALGEVERAREMRIRLLELGAPAPGDPHALPPESGPATLEGAAKEDGSA